MKTCRLFTAGLLASVLLVSCSSKDTQSEESVQTRMLTLKISGSGYGSSRTSGTTPTDEAGVKNLAIVVFNGTSVENIMYVENVEVTDGTITEQITYKASSPKIKVVANVPENAFSGMTTADGFNNVLASLDNTTASYVNGVFTSSVGDNTTPGPQKSDVLPMIGTAGTIGTGGTASVSLYRLVSRISLSGITSDFSNTMYAGWSLKIDQIFLANVPVSSTLSSEWDTAGGGTSSTTSSLMQGETTNATVYKSYLGSGVLGGVDATSSAYTTNHYFYVFPNSSTTFSSQTKLIIKAKLYDASNTDQGTYYYPIVINRSQSGTSFNETTLSHDGTVRGNVTYTLDATIKGKGVLNATDDLKPSDINLNVTVSGWSAELTQSVVFN
jgi:hypothetical protein